MEFMSFQYNLVQSSREVVFQFCEGFSGSDYIALHACSGKSSIRNLHVHIANTYIYWVGHFALKKNLSFFQAAAIINMQQTRDAFTAVNRLVADFLQAFKYAPGQTLNGTSADKKQAISSTPAELFTHVITHEFHHKGQIMTHGRHLGYLPPDADVIRFS